MKFIIDCDIVDCEGLTICAELRTTKARVKVETVLDKRNAKEDRAKKAARNFLPRRLAFELRILTYPIGIQLKSAVYLGKSRDKYCILYIPGKGSPPPLV